MQDRLYQLFEHMSDAHGLTLLDDEMEQIINVCKLIIFDDLKEEALSKSKETLEIIGKITNKLSHG